MNRLLSHPSGQISIDGQPIQGSEQWRFVPERKGIPSGCIERRFVLDVRANDFAQQRLVGRWHSQKLVREVGNRDEYFLAGRRLRSLALFQVLGDPCRVFSLALRNQLRQIDTVLELILAAVRRIYIGGLHSKPSQRVGYSSVLGLKLTFVIGCEY
jgi:hypothetical protein